MVKEKPLAEKKDYYSQRRKAFIDIQHWISEGLGDNEIIFNLLYKYGFSKQYYYEVEELLKAKIKETNKTGETNANSDQT